MWIFIKIYRFIKSLNISFHVMGSDCAAKWVMELHSMQTECAVTCSAK